VWRVTSVSHTYVATTATKGQTCLCSHFDKRSSYASVKCISKVTRGTGITRHCCPVVGNVWAGGGKRSIRTIVYTDAIRQVNAVRHTVHAFINRCDH